MSFFVWLEETAFAEWIRVSVVGYPLLITLHSIGLAVVVGVAIALDLRLLGRFEAIPLESITRLLGVAWAGFWINLLSGVALFTMTAASYVTNVQFLLKMALVVLGVVTLNRQAASIRHHGLVAAGDVAVPGALRLNAVASLVFWIGAILTGRLIAYLG